MADPREIRLAGTTLGRARHVSAFFHDKTEELRVLLPFIREGFEQGDRIFQIMSADLRNEHLERLRQAGVDVKAAQASGQLVLKSWDEAYLRGGRFDQDAMLAFLKETLDEGRARGFPRTRLIADMEWALEGLPGVHDVVEYEARVDELLAAYEDPVLCTYDTSKFGGRIVIDVMRTHPVVIVGNTLHENPFYVPPREFLKELQSRSK